MSVQRDYLIVYRMQTAQTLLVATLVNALLGSLETVLLDVDVCEKLFL